MLVLPCLGNTTAFPRKYTSQIRCCRIISDASFNAVPVTYTYETAGANTGLRTHMTDASGTTNYFYNGTRMFAKDTPMGTLRYTYDPMGNVLTIGSQTFTSTVVGPTATYTYDKLNRLSTVKTSYSSLLSGGPPNGATTFAERPESAVASPIMPSPIAISG